MQKHPRHAIVHIKCLDRSKNEVKTVANLRMLTNISYARAQYLAETNVKTFLQWLRALVMAPPGSLTHSYRIRLKGRGRITQSWSCGSLREAWQHYEWGKGSARDFIANKTILDKLQSDLHDSLRKRDERRALATCIDVQKWGGTLRNIPALMTLSATDGLITYLPECKAAFAAANGTGRLCFPASFISNAGFTKIYSLLCEDFVIYDSRVAAALGMLIIRWCKQHRPLLTKVPPTLSVRWKAGKEGARARVPKNRNPSRAPYELSEWHTRGSHVTSNVWANWLLSAAVPAGRLWGITRSADKLRALEAALFMVGYEVPGDAAL
ncbi:MAG TPA: hypothetical protein VHY19_09790 [Steroidobacteraceae bacterium]|jgi:hypothetical protein|nr:hypothetical protein [Steroidobacteraceae bacterium]